MNIAIFTPSQNPYSETFIQAHKNYLKGNISYYYGSFNSLHLEGEKDLLSNFERKALKLSNLILRKSKRDLIKKRILYSLKKNRIEAILIEYGTHAHNIIPLIKEAKLPMIVHFHGNDASAFRAIKNTNNYKDVFRYANKIIVVSKVMEQMLFELGCPKEKLIYNVYGPQPEFHEVKPRFNKKQFIGIGRFTDKKAPYYTILAFAEVIKKHPDAKLFLAGKGALYNVCKNLITYYKIEANVILLGVITPEQYRTYLEESLAFVQHSVRPENGDMEGTPLSVLEASSAGLPVISTFHAGIPDVIIDGETGLLCKEHDLDTMASNMLKIIEDKSLAIKMGEAGKKNIQENFSLKKHISNLQEIIQSVIG